MSTYSIQKVQQRSNLRYMLSEDSSGTAVGLMILPVAGESYSSFHYNFTAYLRNLLSNVDQFPELSDLRFFGIEYLNGSDWQGITLISAESVTATPAKGYLLKIGRSANGFHSFLIYDETGIQLIGSPIFQMLNESDYQFSRDYGYLSPRSEFINIDHFPELQGIRNCVIDRSASANLYQPVEMIYSFQMENMVFLLQKHKEFILVYGASDKRLFGSVVAAKPHETYQAFSHLYGNFFTRGQFNNVNEFAELQGCDYFAIAPFNDASGVHPTYQEPLPAIPVAATPPSGAPPLPVVKTKKQKSPVTPATSPAPVNLVGIPTMDQEKTYLELSEAEGGSHKFYEVTVTGSDVTIRYGRIGDQGQTQTKTYATPEKAKADAAKKIKEKLSKGYEHAQMGVRQKRAITRRQIVSNQAVKGVQQSPIVWRFASGAPAFGIFVDDQRCWVGNQNGQIFALDLKGQVLNQFRLPDGVKCIVADGDWLYAGCDDGRVYDLTGKVPRVAFEIALDVDIFWLDIRDGVLGISDADGRVTLINHEDESQWMKKSSGTRGWMVRCDEIGLYHGHSEGVTMYDWEDGRVIWDQKTGSAVLFGWQEESVVFAGTANSKIHCFSKNGEAVKTYSCDAAVYACAATEDGKYVFAGDNYSSIYCFTQAGDRLWKLNTGCGSAYSMQFFNDRLYIVTTDGSLASIDASEAAITAAQAGTVPKVVDIKAPDPIAPTVASALETTTDRSGGVLVECFREGGKLRIRVISEGYNSTWRVQFPKDIREEGAYYLVEEMREATQGGFYRAYGDIKKLVAAP